MDSVGEGKGGLVWENGIETCILSYVNRIASPGSMHDMEWEVGGGFRIGNSCTPVADSCQCMAKPVLRFMGLQRVGHY